MTVEAQFHDRLAQLKSELDEIEKRYQDEQPDLRPHLDAICARADAVLKSPAASTDLMSSMRTVVQVERLLRLARELQTQRIFRDADLLLLASRAASEGYQQVMRGAHALGARLQVERWPEPAVLLEPMATPATFVRDSLARPLGLTGGKDDPLPFPVVLLPAYPRSAVGALCWVHHEVGHNLDEDLGISEEYVDLLEQRLQAARVGHDVVSDWLGWCREIIADAFATMLAGIGFVLELADWASATPDQAALVSATHPYPSLRLALAQELLRCLGVTGLPPEFPPLSAPLQSAEVASRFGAQVPVVVRTLTEAPLACLAGGSLGDLAPALAPGHGRICRTAVELAANAGPVDLRDVALRSFPSVARVATFLGGTPAHFADRLFEAARERSRGQAAVPFTIERYRATTQRPVTTPILDEERDGLKLPPPGLFQKASQVAFVGATNDGLPGLFAAYRGARKRTIEVFFLVEESLKDLDGGGRDARENIRLARAGRAGLTPDLMNAVAEQWTLYEHDQPFVFASYWDASGPGGRIHVSAHAWGQDLKRAPSHDYIWPPTASQPERTYRFYLDALSSLRQRARKLAGS